MRFTFLRLLTRRPDRRPLYRRIFTNKRLDIAHLVTLRLLFGTVLLISSFSAVNIFVYYKYIKPIQREKAEQIEKELLEADLAGFKVNVRKFLNLVGSNYASLFLFGASSGAAFELFKIKFTFMGFNYYTSFTRLQVPKELNAFEAQLKEKDDILMKKYEPDFLKNDSEKN